MKKNIMMRLSAVLLVAVLLTTCVISGTWAKYVSTGSSGEDNAQVAKWGVVITAEAKDNKEYADKTLSAEETAVIANASIKHLAPGDAVKFASINVTGTPEVAVKVEYTATLELDGWVIDSTVEYMPLVFVINGLEYSMKGFSFTQVADFEAKIAEIIAAYSKEYAAGTNLALQASEELTVSCYWAFEGDNASDTKLGDLATAPTVSLTINCSVTQLDTFA